ncbi:MAG TPA: SgcJ/EcaC family oxidoreductase [Candidatus Binataceae bacterium]|nr:SgcJ/EcaC family oxidoreductase [Candidatus Binataceae bacterium]
MPARKPEECDLLLIEALNKGDLEAAVALYEPSASMVQDSGEVVIGHAAIREIMKGFLAIKPRFTIKVDGVQSGDGTLALTQATWSVSGTDADGKPVTMGSRSAEVVRRQSDGTWKFVIDNPHGGEKP